MNKVFLNLALLILCLPLMAQNDCSAIASFATGRSWSYQWHDADQRVSFRSQHTVTGHDAASGHDEVQVEIINFLEDTVYTGNYRVRCTEDGLVQDLLGKLTPNMLSSLKGLEVETQGSGWRLPHGIQPGDSIPQSYSHLTGYKSDLKIVELDLAIGPVHILEQEDLTTPAGGFPCVAMAYELWVTQTIRKRFRLRDWFAPGVGVIRREIFDRRGKFFGYCELVDWTK